MKGIKNKNLFALRPALALLFIVFSLAGCTLNNDDEPQDGRASTAQIRTARIRLNVEYVNRTTPLIQGSTNLPDGAEITVEVQHADGTMIGRDETIVRNGTFVGGPFGPPQGLTRGKYRAIARIVRTSLHYPSLKKSDQKTSLEMGKTTDRSEASKDFEIE